MTQKRFWEIDALRGVAIVMMVIYHAIFDLWYLDVYDFAIHDWPLWLFGRSIPVIFLILVGISLTLSHARSEKKAGGDSLFPKYLKRGVWIFSLGLLLTAVTWFLIGKGYIVFGILHLIGVSIILTYPFVRKCTLNVLLGLSAIFAGIAIRAVRADHMYLVWLGVRPDPFVTLDYFPLLPWFGFVLIGIALGNWYYSDGKRDFDLVDRSEAPAVKGLGFLGRHSLLIYLVHQPMIILILATLGYVDIAAFS